jgi:hypothetical protein
MPVELAPLFGKLTLDRIVVSQPRFSRTLK